MTRGKGTAGLQTGIAGRWRRKNPEHPGKEQINE